MVTYVFNASTQEARVDGSLSSMLDSVKNRARDKAAVTEEPGLSPSTYIVAQLYVTTFPGSLMASVAPVVKVVHRYTCRQNTHTHKKK